MCVCVCYSFYLLLCLLLCCSSFSPALAHFRLLQGVAPSVSLSMLFCSCKLDTKGRHGRTYVFEVLSPRKTYYIAVNTAVELREWVELLQGAQADLMTQTLYASMTRLQLDVNKDAQTSEAGEAKQLLKELREHPENAVCADCNGEGALLPVVLVHSSSLYSLVLITFHTQTPPGYH